MKPEGILSLPPDIIWRVIDDGVVLVDPENGKVTALNEVGTFIWGLVDRQHTVAEIVQALVDRYTVSSDQAERDLQTFITELESRHLISWASQV